MSADGSVVAGVADFDPFRNGQACLWSALEPPVGLGFLEGDTASFATNISGDGRVVVGVSGAFTGRPFRWTAATGSVELESLPDAVSPPFNSATACSFDGDVVVGWQFISTGVAAFSWQAGVSSRLAELPGGDVFADPRAMTPDARIIVGGSSGENGYVACRWEGGTATPLGHLPGGMVDSFAFGISADGTTIVGVSHAAGGYEAFRHRDQNMVSLGDLPGGELRSWALACSADGTRIVGDSTSAVGQEAFLWDPEHGMRSLRQVLVDEHGLGLDLEGWQLLTALDITPDGMTIVGTGTNPDGNNEAYIAHLGDLNPCIGDVDGDYAVGLSDLAILLSHFRTLSGATPADGDVDDDNDVDLSDLAALLATFGTVCP